MPTFKFFYRTQKDEVFTPSRNILKGITRKKILGLSEFNVKESNISIEDLKSAKEAFITSTTKNVLPVLEIDRITIADGNPGKITTEIYSRICKMKEK